jgi:hypothetical protein
MVDILQAAKKTRKAGTGKKDVIRIAFDLTLDEHKTVAEYCYQYDLAISKLAKVLLLDFVRKQKQQEKERK